MHHPTDKIAHTTAFVTPVVEHWLERKVTKWVRHEGSIRQTIASWANDLTTELHLALQIVRTFCHDLTDTSCPRLSHLLWWSIHTWYSWSSDRSLMVDKLSYFSLQPVFHDWRNKGSWYVLSCLWDDAYKRTLAANQK